MEERRDPDNLTMEDLTHVLFGVAAIRRDLRKRAGLEQLPVGLGALGAIQRIGPARVSDIATELQVDLSVASRQVQALEAEGYVERAPDPDDRRSSVVSLSPSGDARLGRVHRKLAAALRDAMVGWQPAEVRALVDGLQRLRADLACPPAGATGRDRSVLPPGTRTMERSA